MSAWQDLTAKHPRHQMDRRFYEKVRSAKSHYRLLGKFSIPPYSGRGFTVQKGQTFRVIEETGPQVGSVAFWNAHNPQETFLAALTWAAEGVFVKLYTQLTSGLPWLRPMMTCVEDTVVTEPPGGVYHHHLLGSHCSPELMEMRFGVAGMNACRLNLLQAIEPFGLNETDLHDNVNVHQKASLEDPDRGKIRVVRSDAKRGGYVEFYAEMDLLVAVSVCPFGDGTSDPTSLGRNEVRPLGIELYETGIAPRELPKWTDWRPNWKGRWIRPLAEGVTTPIGDSNV